jgi:alkanesulfonate monooxygenase SsuD/methylene tetrahydromethanopterin reductase-like flavin-dependent oxidoreductase (luciferase family)
MRVGVVPAHGPQLLQETIQQAKLCEDLGIDSIWIEEHHGQGGYWPTPLIALAAIASHTERVQLGTNILILPLYDPVHIAEQFAVLDVMTGGRMVLGTSIGDSAKEFAMFRVQANRRGQIFEEQIQVIRKLWETGEVSMDGEIFHFDRISIPVPPVQQRGPPIWIGGWGPRQVERAARLGNAWFPGPVSDLPGVVQRLENYTQLLKDHGKDPSARVHPLTRDIILSETEEEAWELAEKELLPAYQEDYLASDHPLVGKDSGAKFQGLRDLARDRLIIGNPETVTREAIRVIRATHTDHLVFRLKLPGISPVQITRSIKLLSREVIPHLIG